jgi:hypothetical protein
VVSGLVVQWKVPAAGGVTDTSTGFVDKPSVWWYSRDGGSPLRRPGVAAGL